MIPEVQGDNILVVKASEVSCADVVQIRVLPNLSFLHTRDSANHQKTDVMLNERSYRAERASGTKRENTTTFRVRIMGAVIVTYSILDRNE